MRESLFGTLRADAEKWREIAAEDGGGTDRKAEEILALLAELDRLRRVETAFVRSASLIVCPRCEGQRYDVDACGMCRNTGWLDCEGDALEVPPPPVNPCACGHDHIAGDEGEDCGCRVCECHEWKATAE